MVSNLSLKSNTIPKWRGTYDIICVGMKIFSVVVIDDTNKFKSPFLEKKERLLENEGFVIYDGFPVSKGHCLIVPHRVYSDYFDSTSEEVIGLQNSC